MFNLFKKKATEVSKEKSSVATISQSSGNTNQNNARGKSNSIVSNLIKSPSPVDDEAVDDEDELDYDYTGTVRTLDLKVEISGAKGWPADVSIVYYHKLEGLICVGTVGGAIYVYGDGFQIMRTWFSVDPNEVTFISQLFPDQILVCFADNSILVFELPSLNLVVQLGSKWINAKSGNITTVYVDEPGQLNFAYIGTSEGNIYILDISIKGIRICDYTITWKMVGLKSAFAITDIAICPKDEKYIAISYDAILTQSGHVAIFDLVKQKSLRVYDTHVIVSMAWQHQGDILYAATKHGKIVCYGIDKTSESLASQWRADQEKVDRYADNDDEQMTTIKKIQWLAPQPPSQEGCLFILLASSGTDNDDLKSVIVGLSPQNGNNNDLQLVFALPPVSFEKIVNFAIIPSYEDDPHSSTTIMDDSTTIATPDITPALLIVSQKPNELDETQSNKHLKAIRCPVVDMNHWALEVGTLPDPRKAIEVLPSVSKITCMIGFVQEDSGLSLALALLAKSIEIEGSIIKNQPKVYESDEDDGISSAHLHSNISKAVNSNKNTSDIKGKRLSARDFLASQIKELEDQLNEYGGNGDKWQMVLASGVHQDNLNLPGKKPIPRLQDIIVHGHEDGTIIAWGVSLSKSQQNKDIGKGSIWLPLVSLRCGTTTITTITEDESAGLLLVADESGTIVIWEVSSDNQGALAILQDMKTQATNEGKRIANECNKRNNDTNNDDDDEDYDEEDILTCSNSNKYGTKYSKYISHVFDNVREVLRTTINRHISASLLLSSFLQVFVGTVDGKLFTCNLPSNQFKEIVHAHKPAAFNSAGAIVSLAFGYFYHSDRLSVPCIYVAYQNGLVTTVQLNTLQLISYSNKYKTDMKQDIEGDDDDDDDNDQQHQHQQTSVMPEICISNSLYEKLLPPTIESVSILYAEDHINNVLNITSPTKIIDSNTDNGRDRSASKFLTTAFKNNYNMNDNSINLNSININTRKKIHPRSIPRYLMIIRGKFLLTYDLNKFKRASNHLCIPGFNGYGIHSKMISQKPIITYKFITLMKENNDSDIEDGNYCDSKLCIMDINSNGTYGLIATKEKAPLGHHNILEGILDYKCDLKFGCFLLNGSCYLNDSDMIIYNVTTSVTNNSLKFIYQSPDRASPDSAPPSNSMLLISGRDELIAIKKASLNKRRQSVIKLTAAPTDLMKLFAKSLDQKQKEELTSRFDSDDDNDTRSPSSTTSRSSAITASKALNVMNDTYQALHERGDRINKLALQSDDLNSNAQQFRDTAIKQKEILKKRNTKWGFF